MNLFTCFSNFQLKYSNFLVQFLSFHWANPFLRLLATIPIDWAMTVSVIMMRLVMFVIWPNRFHSLHAIHSNCSIAYFRYVYDHALSLIHQMKNYANPVMKAKHHTLVKKKKLNKKLSSILLLPRIVSTLYFDAKYFQNFSDYVAFSSQ